MAIARQKQVAGLDTELDKIGKAADYLEDIIADVLSLPVSSQEQRPLDDVVELNSLLSALIDDLHIEAEEKSLSFDVSTTGEELLIATRGSSLTAALENILRNAIKYSPSGGLVRVLVEESGESCSISVIDSGSGVEEDELEAIFRPFYRTDSARTRESGGFGLGLAIAQRTLLHHGGSITARNSIGAGLCVEIQLPLLHITDD
ncbi:ATP-binding protein [Microbulbifer sp. MLAF003]|uniref:sensor histidine kinase n=1 Tax=Microbulbifer sp. MLAF003 TaxID=3032582 RepID=UPI0024AE38EA|nr:ATP-binding protein [Microbulbifer sp. MLAF003]WHI52494.1 ATP-binding protein [Microbulbifer sp. MLAF003]